MDVHVCFLILIAFTPLSSGFLIEVEKKDLVKEKPTYEDDAVIASIVKRDLERSQDTSKPGQALGLCEGETFTLVTVFRSCENRNLLYVVYKRKESRGGQFFYVAFEDVSDTQLKRKHVGTKSYEKFDQNNLGSDELHERMAAYDNQLSGNGHTQTLDMTRLPGDTAESGTITLK